MGAAEYNPNAWIISLVASVIFGFLIIAAPGNLIMRILGVKKDSPKNWFFASVLGLAFFTIILLTLKKLEIKFETVFTWIFIGFLFLLLSPIVFGIASIFYAIINFLLSWLHKKVLGILGRRNRH